MKSRLNDLSGSAWVKLSKSTWITKKLLDWSERKPLQLDTEFVKQVKPATLPQTPYRPIDETRVKLIEFFTQPNQVVFDLDLQVGDTLQAALVAQRHCIGVADTQQQIQQVIQTLDESFAASHGALKAQGE